MSGSRAKLPSRRRAGATRPLAPPSSASTASCSLNFPPLRPRRASRWAGSCLRNFHQEFEPRRLARLRPRGHGGAPARRRRRVHLLRGGRGAAVDDALLCLTRPAGRRAVCSAGEAAPGRVPARRARDCLRGRALQPARSRERSRGAVRGCARGGAAVARSHRLRRLRPSGDAGPATRANAASAASLPARMTPVYLTAARVYLAPAGEFGASTRWRRGPIGPQRHT